MPANAQAAAREHAHRVAAPATQSGSAIAPAAGSQEGSASHEAAERAVGVGETTILGLPFDSPLVIGAVVLLSLALAAAVWLIPGTPWLRVGVALFGVVTGALDVREIPVQVARGSGLLIVLAALAAVLHLAVSCLAGIAARQLPSHRPVPSVLDARGRQVPLVVEGDCGLRGKGALGIVLIGVACMVCGLPPVVAIGGVALGLAAGAGAWFVGLPTPVVAALVIVPILIVVTALARSAQTRSRRLAKLELHRLS